MCPGGELRAWDKQLFPHHQIYGQGAVTDVIEEDDHRVARGWAGECHRFAVNEGCAQNGAAQV